MPVLWGGEPGSMATLHLNRKSAGKIKALGRSGHRPRMVGNSGSLQRAFHVTQSVEVGARRALDSGGTLASIRLFQGEEAHSLGGPEFHVIPIDGLLGMWLEFSACHLLAQTLGAFNHKTLLV